MTAGGQRQQGGNDSRRAATITCVMGLVRKKERKGHMSLSKERTGAKKNQAGSRLDGNRH